MDKRGREAARTEEEAVFSRRNVMGAAALAGMGAAAMGQTLQEAKKGKTGPGASDPGPDNGPLAKENPNSVTPPHTDHGDVGAIWYSFDLVKKRMQPGGWAREVTERELPNSKELAGVNMRLASGAFRELHWHSANEWAFMMTGEARVSVLQPDGKMFIDDVKQGDLWYFPSGFPHSIQGLGKDGCEFLLVFDEGKFSEDATFLLTDWLAHTPPEVVRKNMSWTDSEIEKLPEHELYIFNAPMPRSLEEDKKFIGKNLETSKEFTYRLANKAPDKTTRGGEVRIADESNFPVANNVSAAMVTVRPGGMRELHWHPTVTEWQFYLKGSARMTVFNTAAKAKTMDFHALDVGFVPLMAGHYIENTGKEDLVFLEMFRAPRYSDVSLNHWISCMPPEMAQAHLKLAMSAIKKIPADTNEILPA